MNPRLNVRWTVAIVLAIAGLVACQRTAPAATTPASPAGARATLPDAGSCAFHATHGSFDVRVDDHVFARVRLDADGGTTADLRFDVDGGGFQTTVHEAAFELDGQLAPARLQVFPRHEILLDGWVRVDGFTPTGVKGGSVQLAHLTPIKMIQPAKSLSEAAVDCGELELGPTRQESGDALAQLVPEKPISLRLEPGGAVVATVTTPKPGVFHPLKKGGAFGSLGTETQPVIANVLERRGSSVRVSIPAGDALDAVGWVDASLLVMKRNDRAQLGGLGILGTQDAFTPERCSQALPIFVREKDRLVQVGTTHAGQVVRLAKGDVEREIDLGRPNLFSFAFGGQADTVLTPFVRAADAQVCVVAKP